MTYWIISSIALNWSFVSSNGNAASKAICSSESFEKAKKVILEALHSGSEN